MTSFFHPPDAELDQQLTGSELLLSTLLQNTVQGSGGLDSLAVTSDGPYDFYQQPNMSEARLCLPVLEQLSVAVKQRLEDWPEHPALVQVSDLFTLRFWCTVAFKHSSTVSSVLKLTSISLGVCVQSQLGVQLCPLSGHWAPLPSMTLPYTEVKANSTDSMAN